MDHLKDNDTGEVDLNSPEIKLITLTYRIKTLEESQKFLLRKVNSLKEGAIKEEERVEKRIRALEDWKVAMYAYGVVLGVLFTVLSRYLK